MKKVAIPEFGPEVHAAVQKAADSYPRFGTGVRLCVLDSGAGKFASVDLANGAQVSQLAIDLVRLGYVLSKQEVDGCDFVLEVMRPDATPDATSA